MLVTRVRSAETARRRGLWRAASVACGLGVGLELALAWPALRRRGSNGELDRTSLALSLFLLCLGTVAWKRWGKDSWARSAAGQLGVLAAGLAAGMLGFASHPWQVQRLVAVLASVLLGAGLLSRGEGAAGSSAGLPWWRQPVRVVAMGAAGFAGAVLLLTVLQVVRWTLDGGGAFHPPWQVLVRGGVALALLLLVRRPASLPRREALALFGAGVAAFPLAELGLGLSLDVDTAATHPGRAAWELRHLWTHNTAVYLALGVLGVAMVAVADALPRDASGTA